jgi:AraC-like DNA-binding protein
VARAVRRTNPELLPAAPEEIDAVRKAHAPVGYKRDLLEVLWQSGGAAALLSIGQELRDVEFDPMWRGAMRAASPAVLLDKWRRVEVFGHSRNRVRIAKAGARGFTFQRYSVPGHSPPTMPENLLVCGVIIALLEEIGCRGLVCDMPDRDGAVHRIYQKKTFKIPGRGETLATASWEISWRAFASRPSDDDVPDPPSLSLPAQCDAKAKTTIETVTRLMATDTARQWKLAELARECGLSARSLQRRLGEGGLNFSKLVRMVRVHEACRLLKARDASLTMIGFCAGFSDSAQFSRDFRASTGMTPSDYRAVI